MVVIQTFRGSARSADRYVMLEEIFKRQSLIITLIILFNIVVDLQYPHFHQQQFQHNHLITSPYHPMDRNPPLICLNHLVSAAPT
jgi:hypothetical protein